VTGGRPLAAVVLAAGAGRRFAGPGAKLRAHLEGRPVILHVLAAVRAAGFSSVAVVEGAVPLQDLLADDVVRLVNPEWPKGLASSLGCGLAWCRRRGCDAVVGLGDAPRVPAAAWRAVADAPPAPVAVASFGGQRQPPVRLALEVFDLLSGEGEVGARRLFDHPGSIVVPCEGDPGDVDTVADLLRLEAAGSLGRSRERPSPGAGVCQEESQEERWS